jgi:DNA-binding NarL/FixJ family response regulator
MPIRPVFADDYRCLLETMRRLLRWEADVHLVAGCQSGEEILPTVHQYRSDVLLLALGSPGTHGLTVLRAMRQAKLATKVILSCPTHCLTRPS